MSDTANLFDNIPHDLPLESVESLLTAPGLRIERIISKGHRSPPDFWYDQQQSEWVFLAKGAARLRFGTDNRTIDLQAGSYLNIPAHEKHRVEWTQEDEETIWLAVFY